jgi:aminoglycoside/choline kinase family phosphotransferase
MTPKPIEQPTAILEKLFEEHFKKKPSKTEQLPVSGSERRYWRLSNDKISAIGTYNSNIAENNTFFYFTELFRKHNILVPEVYGSSKDRKYYLQQDLGSTTLFDKLLKDGITKEVRTYYKKSIEQLARVQWVAGREADFKQCFAAERYDEKAIKADLLYFKYYFADLHQIPYDRLALIDEIDQFSKELGHVQPQMLMYRDFQTRNIMLHNGKPYFIDYQGCMQGPPQYDIASLLWQARAQLPEKLKEELLNDYIASLKELHAPRMDEIHFRRVYAQFVLVRLLQVLGAYGFRGLLQHKPHFLNSIGPALKNLETFLANNPQLSSYPELRNLLEKLSAAQMQQRYAQPKRAENATLHVQIYSFSYKNGIPKDKGTHGGGYVFDCRGLLNPGRYAATKYFTGKDEIVIRFLEQETRMPEFLDHVYSLVSLNVEDYLSRGFEQLTVAFGCTGGQHRSVYAAERLSEYLTRRYNVDNTVTHLNEAKWVLSADNTEPQ